MWQEVGDQTRDLKGVTRDWKDVIIYETMLQENETIEQEVERI